MLTKYKFVLLLTLFSLLFHSVSSVIDTDVENDTHIIEVQQGASNSLSTDEREPNDVIQQKDNYNGFSNLNYANDNAFASLDNLRKEIVTASEKRTETDVNNKVSQEENADSTMKVYNIGNGISIAEVPNQPCSINFRYDLESYQENGIDCDPVGHSVTLTAIDKTEDENAAPKTKVQKRLKINVKLSPKCNLEIPIFEGSYENLPGLTVLFREFEYPSMEILTRHSDELVPGTKYILGWSVETKYYKQSPIFLRYENTDTQELTQLSSISKSMDKLGEESITSLNKLMGKNIKDIIHSKTTSK